MLRDKDTHFPMSLQEKQTKTEKKNDFIDALILA